MPSYVLALLLLASTSTDSTTNEAQPAASQAEARTSEKAKEPKKICRRLDTTGSRTGGQKICMTAEQWRKADLNGF